MGFHKGYFWRCHLDGEIESQHILDLWGYCGDLTVCEEDCSKISELEIEGDKGHSQIQHVEAQSSRLSRLLGSPKELESIPHNQPLKPSLAPGTRDN